MKAQEIKNAKEVKDHAEPFIDVNDLDKSFEEVKPEIQRLQQIEFDVAILNNENLTVAQNQVRDAKEVLNNIETVRKLVKKPYLETTKLIDAYAKELADPIKKFVDARKGAIAAYKALLVAQKRKEEEAKKEEEKKIAKQKAEEADRILRIKSMLNARLYGGSYLTKKGTKVNYPGCKDQEEVKQLMEFVNRNATSVKVQYMEDDYREMLNQFFYDAKDFIEKLDNKENIENLKQQAEKKIEETKTTLKDKIIEEAHKSIKTSEAETKDAGKGLRKNILYELDDLSKVPLEFITIDDRAVRKYLIDNREAILSSLRENIQPVPGIRIYVKETYVSR